jgi:glycosyltransferase involved in cell wall biosynthesis
MGLSSDINECGPNKPLRIAIASPAANAESFIQAHVDRLRDVILVLSDGELPTRSSDGTVLVRENVAGKALDLITASVRGSDLTSALSKRIAELFKKHRIDVVLAEYGNTAAVLVDACRMADVPMVVHFHGIDAHGSDYHQRFVNYRELFKFASKLVVVSRSMEQQLLALGAPREKVVFNCYGVDLDIFKDGDPGSAPPTFISVGRFVEKKAPQLTLLAFRKVVEQVPQARLTMVGNGRLWEACEQMARALDLSGRVDLCGAKDQLVIAGMMRVSRCLVQHSVTTRNGDSEGTPLAILEAMATGIPVVATRHAGIIDAVEHAENGLLCDPFDVDDMARQMIRIAQDPADASRMGANGRRRVLDHYDVRMQVARLGSSLHDATIDHGR